MKILYSRAGLDFRKVTTEKVAAYYHYESMNNFLTMWDSWSIKDKSTIRNICKGTILVKNLTLKKKERRATMARNISEKQTSKI